MTRWIALLLLLVVIAAGVKNEPVKVEQRLHGRVVFALAAEDLSEVRVQLDGRTILLSGPEQLLPQAFDVVKRISGVQLIDTQITDNSKNYSIGTHPATDSVDQKNLSHKPSFIKKAEPTSVESELLVTKVEEGVEINGVAPNLQVKREILKRIERLIQIPEHLIDVSVKQAKVIPEWFLQDLPLLIPFVQWVHEGQIRYQGDGILIDGTVLNNQAMNAIETAIANLSSQFQIENKLKVRTE